MIRPRLLFLSQAVPDPEGNGPARRSHATICAMARTHEVSLLLITPPSTDGLVPAGLPAGCAAWRHLPSHVGVDRELLWRRRLAAQHPGLFTLLFRQPAGWQDHSRSRLHLAARLVPADQFEVIHAFRMVMAPYALAVKKAGRRQSILQMDTDDIESLTLGRIAGLHLANGEKKAAARERTNARLHARLEHRLFPRFRNVFVCSETDDLRLGQHHANTRVLPNVVSVPHDLPPPATPATRFRFLFMGTLGYYPNKDALLWLCREILPALRSMCDCELIVAGVGARPDLIDFLKLQDGVRFLGAVEKSADVFSAADALLVPLRAGGGTRLKILESFAQGRPVISTSMGIEGIAAQPGEHYLAADTPETFIHEARRLAADGVLRQRLTENAFALVSRDYSPRALSQALANSVS